MTQKIRDSVLSSRKEIATRYRCPYCSSEVYLMFTHYKCTGCNRVMTWFGLKRDND